jgi:hypothetical protein
MIKYTYKLGEEKNFLNKTLSKASNQKEKKMNFKCKNCA